MKVVVGLGNPGKKYEHTRHNAGWLALDRIIETLQPLDKQWRKKFDAEILRLEKNLFVKPHTFMNESGKAIADICAFYKIDVGQRLLVVHDDSDLPIGTIRAAFDSSAAGHKGVQSIIDALDTKKFHRLRIGVESRASRNDMPTEAFVLQKFSREEFKILQNEILPKTVEEIQKFLSLQS